MATLEELLNDIGLSVPEKGQEKTASAVATSKEVNDVLENLGLSGGIDSVDSSGVTKQASEKGANMSSLTDIYEDIFETEEGFNNNEEGQEKVASDESVDDVEGEGDANVSESFGSLVGVYFSAAQEGFFDKIAASLEQEAGPGHKVPQGSSQQLAVNHPVQEGKHLETSGSKTPYAGGKGDVIGASIKALLRRGSASANVGETK